MNCKMFGTKFILTYFFLKNGIFCWFSKEFPEFFGPVCPSSFPWENIRYSLLQSIDLYILQLNTFHNISWRKVLIFLCIFCYFKYFLYCASFGINKCPKTAPCKLWMLKKAILFLTDGFWLKRLNGERRSTFIYISRFLPLFLFE